jgi:O-phosphoseryl-tRNA synthetase
VPTNIRFLDAFAAFAARRIEEAGDKDKKEVKVKIVRSGADINIKVEDIAMRYITSKKKKVDIRGPVFITIVGEGRSPRIPSQAP